jgi:hypothetical protein
MPPALVASLSQNQMLDNNYSGFVSLQCRPSGSHGSQIHDLMMDLLSDNFVKTCSGFTPTLNAKPMVVQTVKTISGQKLAP